MSVLILGAGPAGLGAAWRFEELGFHDWTILEASDRPGGLSASFVDAQGFTWDLGGHVLFSASGWFNRIMDQLLGPEGWLVHQREAWIRTRGCYLPYPFQNNLGRLDEADRERCLRGLEQVQGREADGSNFDAWIGSVFGDGIAELFMRPYNRKVWAHPLELLSASWVEGRVARPDAAALRANIGEVRDDPRWGPNSIFRYPRRGGTGAIWQACAARLPGDRLRFRTRVAAVDPAARSVLTAQGERLSYDRLISTAPLTELQRLAGLAVSAELRWSATHAVGVGLRGRPGADLAAKNWIYFPEADCPFYRVTVFSNHSAENVPGPDYWSLLCEISESPYQPVDAARVVEQTLAGLLRTGLISGSDEVVSTWHCRAEHGYPVPSLGRDRTLASALPELEARGIHSCGRFGGWRYEAGNQDHAFLAGAAAAEQIASAR